MRPRSDSVDDGGKWSTALSCGNAERCSSNLLDWSLCMRAMKSSSGTVGALLTTGATLMLAEAGSSLRCSSMRAPC